MQQSDWSSRPASPSAIAARPRVLVDAVDGTMCGVAPLIIDRLRWPARATLAGVADLQEPMDLVYADQASLARLAERLADLRIPLTFGRCRKIRPPSRHYAGRSPARFGRRTHRPTFPVHRLSPGWQDPLAQLSSRRRSDLRRAWKRAEAFGDVVCEVISPRLENLTICSTRPARSKPVVGKARPERPGQASIRSARIFIASTRTPLVAAERFACVVCDIGALDRGRQIRHRRSEPVLAH